MSKVPKLKNKDNYCDDCQFSSSVLIKSTGLTAFKCICSLSWRCGQIVGGEKSCHRFQKYSGFKRLVEVNE